MVVVNPRVDSGVPLDLLNELRQIAPATIGHMLEHEFMEPELRPIISRFGLAGPGLTVRCFGTDSAIVHYAIDIAQPGDVVVVDRLGDRRYACWGGGVSVAAQVRGVAGAVVDGMLTDRVEILELGFPVFGRGISALTTRPPGLNGGLSVLVMCCAPAAASARKPSAIWSGVPWRPSEATRPAARSGWSSRETNVPIVRGSVAGSRPTSWHAVSRAAKGRSRALGSVCHQVLKASPQRAARRSIRGPNAAIQIGGPPGRGPRGWSSQSVTA